ncbi:MAG: hypothetical protein K9N48_01595 [Verrucomicrobia bacterium]|nr:hypothetical protein [Verrucomicrobiota bacterium]
MIRSLKNSEDPPKLIVKWIASAAAIAFAVFFIGPTLLDSMRTGDRFGLIFGVVSAAAFGAMMAVIWTGSIVDILAKPLENLFTGGDTAAEPGPKYSIPEAKRKPGVYEEAIIEIDKVLEEFPREFRGHMFKAEVQAENLKNLDAAHQTIQAILQHGNHTPKNIAYAINRMADWHIKLADDIESARNILGWIPQIFPGTEQSYAARQRLAKLKDFEKNKTAPKKFIVSQQNESIGLRSDFTELKPTEEDPVRTAEKLVARLEENPDDDETREQLCLLYVNQFGRVDLAAEQLEFLINQSDAPPHKVVEWLNKLADYQVKISGDIDAARRTLHRIIDLYPNVAAAGRARERLSFLNVELKGRSKPASVKLGNYEQSIGLKR